MSTTINGVRIVDMPDLGVVTSDSSVVGEHAGSGRFSMPAVAQFVRGGTGIVYVKDYGATADGVTDDAFALIAAINAACALPHGGKVVLPAGRIIVGSAVVITIPAHATITIEGMGMMASELYFSHSTDGLDFQLQNGGAGKWAGMNLRGFAITRGPLSPARANTGVHIWADPAVVEMYNGFSSVRDLLVWPSTVGAAQWKYGVVLEGISQCPIDNVSIQGVNAATTDLGDVMLTIRGYTPETVAVATSIGKCIIVGGSVGVLMDQNVQGVYITDSVIIGNYDSVRGVGYGLPTYRTTTAPTTASQVLHFASGSLAGIVPNSSAAVGGGVPFSIVVAVDNTAGTVTLNQFVTCASGALVGFVNVYGNSDLGVFNCSLNGARAGVYSTGGGFNRVVGTTILHFGNGVSGYGGVWWVETYNSSTVGNVINGVNSGPDEFGVIVESTNVSLSNTVTGNTVNNCGGGGIYLKGAVKGAAITGNIVQQTGTGTYCVREDTPGNAVVGNVLGGVVQDFSTSHSPGAPFPVVTMAGYLSINSPGIVYNGGNAIALRWDGFKLSFGIDGSPQATFVTEQFAVLPVNAANDAAAAAAGVLLHQIYRNGSVLQVRVV